ncbi:MAG: biotin transporter BioY [Clostridiales bacterium]|jgi:biotin transport system substrate-specific component|nr:biotin transporter BioY [Clostridiales bacterium]
MRTTNIRLLPLAALFTALTAIGAFIKIPLPPYPVPMTLQTAFVFLCGLLLPRREAALSQLAYVLSGLMGLPVFISGGGIGYIFNPTFGYLIAFICGAPLLSVLAGKTLYQNKMAAFTVGGLFIIVGIQLLGVAYFAFLSAVYLKTPLAFSRVVYLIVIFIPLDVIKFALAAALAKLLRKRIPALVP